MRKMENVSFFGSKISIESEVVPVTITDVAIKEPASSAMTQSAVALQTPVRGTIRIETEKARLYVEGAAEVSCLRVLLEYLLG